MVTGCYAGPIHQEEPIMNDNQLLAKRSDLKTSHILHLILSIITGGLWLVVWLLMALSNATQRAAIDRQLAGGKKDQNILQLMGLMKSK